MLELKLIQVSESGPWEISQILNVQFSMMTLSNGSIFYITGHLWGESTDHRWIPLTKASDAKLWCFVLSAPQWTIEQTINAPVIWDAIALIMTSL